MYSTGPHVKSASPAQLGFTEVMEHLNTTKASATVLSGSSVIPRVHLTISGNIFCCYKLEERCYWHVVGSDQGQPKMHRAAPTAKNYLVLNIKSSEAEKPWTRTIAKTWKLSKCHQQMSGLRCGIYMYIQWKLTWPLFFLEQNYAIFSNMDGPTDYHTKWSKSERETNTHDLSLICEI